MTIEREAFVDSDDRDQSTGSHSLLANDLHSEDACETKRDELEQKHCQLMELQGQTPEEELVEKARKFVSEVRQLGQVLEGPQARRHWQGILDYWSIYAYRVSKVDLETDLVPFDPARVKPLSDDQFPYAFANEAADATQEMLSWRRLLDECERDLAGDRLLTIVGESGSGRRLLLEDLFVRVLQEGRARRAEFKGSEKWCYYRLGFGDNPIEDMLRSLASTLAGQPAWDADKTAAWVKEHAAKFRKDPEILAELLETHCDEKRLIAIKDFEFLLKTSAEEREVVTKGLQRLLDDPRRRYFLAVTLHRGHAFALKKFGSLEGPLRDGQVLLAFTTAELRHLIHEPAERVGLVFDPGVVDHIVIHIQGEPTALSLLQFTMRRLWRHRERNRITSQAYQQCGAGADAIRIALEEVYEDLRPNQRDLFRRILLEMVQLDATSQFAVSPVSQDDLNRICGNPSSVEQILDRMHDEELIYDKLVGEQRLLNLSGNTVLTAWPRLVGWLDDMRDEHRDRLRLKASAKLWRDRDKNCDLLWRSRRLEEAEAKFGGDSSLTTPEREFLAASRRHETRKRLVKILAIGTPILVFLSFVSGYPFMRNKVEQQQRRYGDATRALIGEDLSGALLQLDAMKSEGILPLALTVSDAKMRAIRKMQGLTQIQLPELRSSRQLGLGENLVNAVVSPAFGQSGQQYVATIRTEKTDEGVQCFVEVSEVSNPQTLVYKDRIRKKTSGCVSFVKIDDALYLIVGTDRLQYVKVPMSAEHKWLPFPKWQTMTLPAQCNDVISVEAATAPQGDHGWLAVIWKTKESPHRMLSVYELDSDLGTLSLREATQFTSGLNESIRIAALNCYGDLVVACGEEQEQANTLIAWRRDRNAATPNWRRAKPPAWVEKIMAENAQRLSDWGWTLAASTPPAWHRIDSFSRAISFSPSGSQFAIASDDGQVIVWSFGDELSRNGATSYETFYSPKQMLRDGAELTVGPKMETELWLGSSVFDVAFIDDHVLLTGGRDRTARIWDLHSSAEILPRTYHEGTVTGVAFAEPNKLVTLTRNSVRTWCSEDYRMLKSPALVQQVAVNITNVDSRVVVVRPTQQSDSGRQSEFVLTELDSGEPPRTNLAPIATDERNSNRSDSVAGIKQKIERSSNSKVDDFDDKQVVSTVISPDGAWVYTASSSAELKGEQVRIDSMSVRRLPDGTKYSLEVPSDFDGLPLAVFSSGDPCRWLVVAESQESHAPGIYSWDLEFPSPDSSVGQPITLPSLATGSATGSKVSSAKTVRALAMTRYRNADVLAVVGKQMSESEGKGVVFVGKMDADKPSDLRWQSTKETGFPHEEEVLCVRFSPLKSSRLLLAAGDAHDCVKLWDVGKFVENPQDSDPAPLIANLNHSSNVDSLAFSPNGDVLATVSSEGEASLWLAPFGLRKNTNNPEQKLRHDAKILCLSFSPSGDWIITGGRDRTARVWSRDGELVGVFTHRFQVTQAWMLDDDRILTFSQRARASREDKSEGSMPRLRFWDASQSKDLSSAELQKLAARQVGGNGLEPVKFAKSSN